jgi:Tfp pilus assembly protein PilO
MMFKLQLQPLLKILSGLSKREKTVLYVTVAIVSLVALDRLIIYPVYTKIISLNKEIKESEAGINRDLRILSQQERILLETKKYASFLANPESEEEAMTSFLKEIENLANKSSLYIVDMKPGGTKVDKDKTKRFQLILSCEGQMEQVIEFMYNVENMDLLVTIDRYQISPKSKDSTIVQCAITISKIAMF